MSPRQKMHLVLPHLPAPSVRAELADEHQEGEEGEGRGQQGVMVEELHAVVRSSKPAREMATYVFP